MSLDAGTPPRTYSDREHLTVTPELQSRTRYGEVEVPLRMRIAARLRQGADNVVQGCIAGAARFGVPSVLDAHGALATRLDQSIRSEARVGARTLMVGACLAIVFGAVLPISGAVVAMGSMVSRSSVKKIQHQTGGTVAQIGVQDGKLVQANDLLLRLDDMQTRSNLQVMASQLNQVRARILRLVAEVDGAETLKQPALSGVEDADRGLDELVASELSLFKARATSRRNQKETLRSHITQLGKQITGISAQLKSRGTEVDLIAGELKGVQTLYDKKLVPLTRLASLQREAARLEGERGQLLSATAEAESKISEAELQIARIDHDFRTEVSKDLREAQDKEAELAERVVVAKDQLAHTDIRAPSSGFVHQLAAHTIGGVITPGEVIMELVPNSDELLIEAHIQPKDIDHVAEGQKALVRLSAFNQRTTPELSGIVSYVSADLTHEKQNAAPDYIVRVMLSGSEIHRLGNVQLVSGMPAELFLQTGSRTIIGMLLKPITDQLHRTFSDP